MPTFGEIPVQESVKALLKDFKAVIDTFRSTLESFNYQIHELKNDWERALKTITLKDTRVEDAGMMDIRRKMEEKQAEIERVSRESSFLDRHFSGEMSNVKGETYQSLVESPLRNLGVSKVLPSSRV